MFKEILTETFPGFLSVRNTKHQIIYLNDNFKDWIKKYADIDPIGMTNLEIAAVVPKNVGDTFLQCHDATLDLLCDANSTGVKKVIEFKGNKELNEASQYFDVLKYRIIYADEPHTFTIAYDITELYVENQYNLYSSTTDILTGAKNRRYLMENKALFYGHFAAMLDMDNFKMINDQEGHLAGDKMLCDFTTFLKENVPSISVLIRLGGDEFLIIFQNGTSEEELYQLLYELRHQFEKRYSMYSYLSFSYGLGQISTDMQETLTHLDKLLYNEKGRIR